VSEIKVSDRAAQRIREIREEQKITDNTPLRISVKSGGCSGLTYDIDFNTKEETQQGDEQFEDNGIQMVVDMRSFLYLAGTQLDYSEGLNGQGFHFQNPNAVRTCSCGESFSL
jgi:iron-sulfur cluster assembly protein